ncbi:hypothetical protein [Haloplanus salinus]|uniref:hypothetical protein n=1 Tax=Haloplanus salinus TaxID=1126245 RepID=UPI0011C058BA|nr:hypothetical protein [Haloplanus salinus]
MLEPPVVVPTVRDEIERGERAGYEYLGVAVDALGESLPIREVPSEADDSDIRDHLDIGEAESILGVLAHGGAVATDDLAARRVAERRDLPVTGSIGLSCLVSNASRSTAKRLTSGSMGGANTEGTTRRSRA